MLTRYTSGVSSVHLACLTLPLSAALLPNPRPKMYGRHALGKTVLGINSASRTLKSSLLGIADPGGLAPPHCFGCTGCNRCREGLSQESAAINRPRRLRSLLDKMQNLRLACRQHDQLISSTLLPMRLQSQHQCACFHTCARDDHMCGRQRFGLPLAIASELYEAVSSYPPWGFACIFANLVWCMCPLTPFRCAMLTNTCISVLGTFVIRHVSRKVAILRDPPNIRTIDKWYTMNGVHIGLLLWFVAVIAPLMSAMVRWMEINLL